MCCLVLCTHIAFHSRSLRPVLLLLRSVQNRIEALEEVERAFVHLDYEVDHHSEHGRPQWSVVPSWISQLEVGAGDGHVHVGSPGSTRPAAPNRPPNGAQTPGGSGSDAMV